MRRKILIKALAFFWRSCWGPQGVIAQSEGGDKPLTGRAGPDGKALLHFIGSLLAQV